MIGTMILIMQFLGCAIGIVLLAGVLILIIQGFLDAIF